MPDEQDRESGNSTPEQTTAKTAFCATCKKRHRLSHWPEGHIQGTAEAETITGAGSAQELGAQTQAQVEKKVRSKKSAVEHKLDAAELERRRQSAIRLGRKLAGTPYSIAVLVTAEPEWRASVSQEEIEDIAVAWADFAEAFGVHATGKIVAVTSLVLAYATTTGKVYSRIKEKENDATFKA